jgi:threonylcarbamoyladenosine tRNA methylthiotransferase MtaB
MRRRYTAAHFRAVCETLYTRVPDLALTSDVIVGFPGETEEQFENTYRLASDIRFTKMHVFKYSPRTGTLAARWADDVSPLEKERRSRRLIALSDEMALQAASLAIDRTVEVLVENRDRLSGLLTGLTSNYLRVFFDGSDDLRGRLVRIGVESAGVEGAYGALTGIAD